MKKKDKTFSLEPIAKVAKELQENPWKGPILMEKAPEAMTSVLALAKSPFFRFTPFGSRANPKEGAQRGALSSPHRNKWLVTGNRAGKTLSTLYEDLCDCLRLDPISKGPSDRFPADRPVEMWVVSDTEETSVDIIQKTLVHDLLGTDESGFMWNFVDDSSKYTEKSGFSENIVTFTNGSSIRFKYSTQKRKTFQGVSLSKVHIDEVQPIDICKEAFARVVDQNGYILGSMTPIYERNKGIPWIYEDLYLQREEKGIEFHNWTLLDNPFIDEAAKQRLLREWDEDEIDARVYGMFVPLGVKLALPTQVMRKVKSGCQPPSSLGDLTIGADGKVSYVTKGAA